MSKSYLACIYIYIYIYMNFFFLAGKEFGVIVILSTGYCKDAVSVE